MRVISIFFFFFQAEDGIRDHCVTGVQTCALPISSNDSTTHPISVFPRSEDLAIGVQGLPDPVLAGDELTIRNVITNYGPDDAYSPPDGDGVQVDIPLPPELTILSITPGP